MNKFVKIIDNIYKFMTWICLLILILLIMTVSTNVIGRYFFNHTFSWADEVGLVLLSWVSIIAISLGVRMNLHISITFIVDRFPKVLQTIIEKISYVLTIIFGAAFAVYGYKIFISGLDATLPATKLPSSTSYIFVPISGILIIITCLEELFNKKKECDFESYFMEGKIDGK